MASPAGVRVRGYFAESRAHRYSLLFALPLLLLYELLEAVAPIRSGGGVVRNGADVLLTSAFVALLGPWGPTCFMAIVIGVALVLAWRDRKGGIRPMTFAIMLLESAALALAFGAVVGTATVHLLGPLHALSAGAVAASPLASLTLSLGAGLYEELLFRVVLVALLSNGLRLAGLGRMGAGVIATFIGALVFSAFHYVGPMGDPFRLESFVFRAIAGVAFSALYLTRGFGITAWTHALYDVAVMM